MTWRIRGQSSSANPRSTASSQDSDDELPPLLPQEKLPAEREREREREKTLNNRERERERERERRRERERERERERVRESEREKVERERWRVRECGRKRGNKKTQQRSLTFILLHPKWLGGALILTFVLSWTLKTREASSQFLLQRLATCRPHRPPHPPPERLGSLLLSTGTDYCNNYDVAPFLKDEPQSRWAWSRPTA